MTHPFFHIYK